MKKDKYLEVSKITVGYIRCSGFSQVSDGEALPRQEQLIRDYCKFKEIGNLKILVDEAKSGGSRNRSAFKELIRLCESGSVERVICTDLSRLSRSVRDTLEFIEDVVDRREITFICLNQNIDTSSSVGKFFITIVSAFNELYRRNISERMTNAWAFKRRKGEKTSGKLPFGFDLDGKKLIPNAGEQVAIQLIKQLRNDGMTLDQISNELFRRGIKTKTGKEKFGFNTLKLILERDDKRFNVVKVA